MIDAAAGGPVLQIRMLGPLEVFTAAGQQLALGTPKQRAVLALLLARAGMAVPVEEIIDELWDDRPPASASANAKMYAANLRRLFAETSDAGAPDLVKTGGGYLLLSVNGAEFDLADFRDLVRRARTCGDAYQAAALLTEGAELWRGSVLADVPGGPVLAAWRVTIEEERLTALEDLAAALLATGEPALAAAQAREVLVTHPLRERAHAALMTALHASGDSVGALAAFDAARRILEDQLGIEPGEELRRLRQSIVDSTQRPASPVVVSPADAGVGTKAVVPRQLPADVVSFVGRVGPLRRLDTLLPDGTRPAAVVISAIAGTAGVGKTALAVHWAHQVSDRFPDGQLYVNLRGYDPAGSPMDPAEALRGFLDALEVPTRRIPSSVEAQAGLYRSLLSGRRMLVVLDNARNAEQVRPLLPGAPGCLALVTSRNQLAGLVAAEGARLLALDLLSIDEARRMLARRIGRLRVAAEPDAVDEIIARCARLPLALAVAAARAATQPTVPLAAVAAELRDTGGRLDMLDAGDAFTDVRGVFSWSYQTLSVEAARLFRLLGLHPGPDISVAAAASVAGMSIERVRAPLTELTRAHMLTEHVLGRYTFHDLLRAYAAELVQAHDGDSERTAATCRAFDHYLHTAHAAALLLHSFREPLALAPVHPGTAPEKLADQADAQAWFTVEKPVLMAAIRHAASARLDTYAWQLAWTLTTFFQRLGHWDEQIEAQGAALVAARRLADPVAQTHAYRSLARIHARTGRFDEAHGHLAEALDLLGEIGDTAGQAHTHFDRATLYEFQGLPRQSIEEARRSLDLYRAAGHRQGEALAHKGLGWFHALVGEHREALDHSRQALVVLRGLRNPADEADCLSNVGYVHHQLGEHREAIRYYESALDLYRQAGGDRLYEATVLSHLGDSHLAHGDHSEARVAWEQALEILHTLGDPQADKVRAKLGELPVGSAGSPASPLR